MLSEVLERFPVAAELAGWDSEALLDGKWDRGELSLVVAPAKIARVCEFLKSKGFDRLSSITAVDWYPAEPRFEVVYHLHDLRGNRRLRLKCRLAEGETIPSVTGVWRGANWYEREVWDLFGIRFDGHPDLRRILLPEDWTDHPLRKDYPVHGRRYDYAGEAGE